MANAPDKLWVHPCSSCCCSCCLPGRHHLLVLCGGWPLQQRGAAGFGCQAAGSLQPVTAGPCGSCPLQLLAAGCHTFAAQTQQWSMGDLGLALGRGCMGCESLYPERCCFAPIATRAALVGGGQHWLVACLAAQRRRHAAACRYAAAGLPPNTSYRKVARRRLLLCLESASRGARELPLA